MRRTGQVQVPFNRRLSYLPSTRYVSVPVYCPWLCFRPLSHSCRAKELLMLMSTMHHKFRVRVNLPHFADDLLFPQLPLFNTAPAGSASFSLVFVFARVWCSVARASIPIFCAWRSFRELQFSSRIGCGGSLLLACDWPL